MSERIGLALVGDRARAVLMRGDAVVWTNERQLDDAESLFAALHQLLSSARTRRWWRASLAVGVDGARAQVKRIEGLPDLPPATLTRLVSENAATFFLKRTEGVVTSNVTLGDDGPRVAAFHREVVDAIVRVADSTHLTLLGIAPLDPRETDPAVAAANFNGTTPLAWSGDGSRERRRERMRFVSAVTALIGLAVLATVAPIIRGVIDERRMARELVARREVEVEAMGTTAELERVSRLLDRRIAFDAQRGRVVRVLAKVVGALPDSTAIASIRIDSSDVSLVALSPRVTDALSAFSALEGATGARVTGAVSNDVRDGVRLQRAAMRFRLMLAEP